VELILALAIFAEVPSMSRRALIVPLLALACTLAPAELSAQVTPVRDVFRISPQSYGSADPGRYETHPPTAAALEDGTFVVAWEEDLEVEPPGEPSVSFVDLYVRKLAADGALGRLVRVERGSIEPEPGNPDLAADGQGGFVLAWERAREGVSDVLYQRVPADQVVHRGGTSLQTVGTGLSLRFPAVAANADGDWVIAWEEGSTFEHFGHDIGIRAFRASGEPATPVIRIESSGLEQSLIQPRVAMQSDGSFMVVWRVADPQGLPRVQGRTFAADGTPLSPIVQVAPVAGSWEVVAGDPSRGEFLVAWSHSSASEPVRVRRYSPEGTRLATTALGGSRLVWRLRANHQGDLVFLWTDRRGNVRARLLDQNAAVQGPPFLITRIVDDPWLGDIAISDTGRIFATWIAQGEVTTPGGATHRPVVGRIWQAEE
jgi:hypothetical protein